jgi:predicted secreted protein
MVAGNVTQQVTVNADTVQLTTTDNGAIAQRWRTSASTSYR